MSEVAHRDEGFMVQDGVLTSSAFHALGREVARGDYRQVHAQKWDRSWRLWDGQPLRGSSVYFDPQGVFGWKGATYPTSTAVDALIDAVRAMAKLCPDIAGEEGVDWTALYLSPWLYPVGSALSLHRDANRYGGSFTFFVHARWDAHWGGELVVSRSVDDAFQDEEPGIEDGPAVPADPGIATCVTPLPNRMVLLGPNRPHRVARVDTNAGSHVRASIAGFFLRSP